jgi:hypothetical protein
MSILEDMMKGKLGDFQNMLPKEREVEGFKIISTGGTEDFNNKADELIKSGYEPFGFLTIKNDVSYVQGFIKYKKS